MSFIFISVDLLKKRWKHLKDQYRKELKKKPVTKSGAPTENWVSSWQYFNRMYFLKDELLREKSTDNLPNIEGELQEIGDYAYQIYSPSPKRAAEPNINILKRSLGDLAEEINDVGEKRVRVIDEHSNNINDNDDLTMDADYMYLMSILPTVRNLSEIQKLRFRGKVNDFLLKAITENESIAFNNYQGYYPTSVKNDRHSETISKVHGDLEDRDEKEAIVIKNEPNTNIISEQI